MRGGLTLDEGIYIAQIVAQTGDFVFEMSVLCIASGFSFVKVIIFSYTSLHLLCFIHENILAPGICNEFHGLSMDIFSFVSYKRIFSVQYAFIATCISYHC